MSEFNKEYPLVHPSHPILATTMDKFDFNDPPVDPVKLAKDLLDHMRYYRGIGLSANQLGLPYRVFAMEGDPGFVCFNPVITATGNEEVSLDEGCLTYPGLFVKLSRPQSIRVRFQDPYGNVCVKKFSGMSARCFQHECEHLNGVNFLSKVSRLKLERARVRQDKMLKKIRSGRYK